MKIPDQVNITLAIATALLLGTTLVNGQVFNTDDVMRNRAVAASPRAKEEFPWLERRATVSLRSQPASTTVKSALAILKENTALAASPRMKEQFPELARSSVASSEYPAVTRARVHPLTAVRRNSALAASPRMKELYPELRFHEVQPIEVAPLK